MLRKDQFDIDLPRLPHPGAVGMDHHPLLKRAVAGGDERLSSLDLHHTDAAGANLVEFLEIAEAGNHHSGGARRLKNARPLPGR